MFHPRRSLAAALHWFLALAIALVAAPASAATLSWGTSGTGGDGTWGDAGAWWNGSSQQTWSSAAPDDARFGGTGGTVAVTTTATANSLTFDSFTASYTITLSSGQTLAIGGSGMTLNSGAGAVTISGGDGVAMTAAQAWTNNSTSLLTVSTTVANNGFRLTVTGTGNTSIDGVIAGSGALTKSGGGTLTLTGANTYLGATTISGGTLQIGAGADAGSLSGGGPIYNNSVLVVNRSDTLTQSTGLGWLISGTGAVTNAGAGALVLDRTNYYSGLTRASSGTITLANTFAIRNSAIDTTGAGTFSLGGGVTAPVIGGLSGTGASVRNLSTIFDSTSYAAITNLTLNPQSGVTLTYSGTIDLSPGLSLTMAGSGTQQLTSPQSYTGTTSLLLGSSLGNAAAGTLQLTGSGAIASSAAYVFTGGNLLLTNANSAQGNIDRLRDDAAITANGGTLTVNNTLNTGTYSETVGSVSLESGQFNIVLGSTMSTGTQALTFAGLSRAATASGSTATVTFAVPTSAALLSATNRIIVNGVTPTVSGSIVGPWATVGTAANTPTDFAIYTSGSTVAAWGVATAVAESTWTSGSAYVITSGTSLGGSRTVLALKSTGATPTLTIGAANRLATYGLLNAAGTTLTATTGILSTPVGGGQLFLAANGGITITSTIANASDGGVVTLVKSGAGTLTLSGSNSFTGGIVMNGGSLSVGTNGNLNASGNTITFNTSGSLLLPGTLVVNGAYPIVLNNGAIATFQGTSGDGQFSTSGAVTGNGGINLPGGNWNNIFLTSTANTFTGPILLKVGSGGNLANLTLASLGDGLSPIVFGNGNGGTSTVRCAVIISGAVAPITLNNRWIEMASTNGAPTQIYNNNASASNTLTINTDVNVTGTFLGAFSLQGTNTGLNTFAGRIPDGPNAVVSLVKADAGTWVLTGTNSYSGGTTLSGGTLQINNANALGVGTITGSGGTLQPVDADFTLANAVSVGSSGLTLSGTRTLTLSGSVTGGGAITKTGAGTLSLAAVNTYAGTITGSAGGLAISNTRALQYATLAMSSSAATFSFGTLDPVLGGLSSPATASGSTAIINMNGRTFTIGNNNLSTTYTGTLTNGGLTKVGNGTLALTASNSYTGTTSINAGTLQMGNASAFGPSGTIDFGGGILQYGSGITADVSGRFNHAAAGERYRIDSGANTITFATNLSSSGGSFEKLGSGTLTLAPTNSFSGETRLTAGVLSGSAAGNFGSGGPLVFNGGTLRITGTSLTSLSGLGRSSITYTSGSSVGFNIDSPSNVFAVDSALSLGSGGLTKSGSGTIVLNQSNTYWGPTTISGGTFQIGAGSNAGSLSGTTPILNNAALIVNRSDAITQSAGLGAIISGTGTLTTVGNGTLVLDRLNIYTGLTRASSGTIALANTFAIRNSAIDTTGAGGFSLGSGVTAPVIGGLSGTTGAKNLASVFDSASYGTMTGLTLNPAGSGTYAGTIADGALGMNLTMAGAGTQVLTGSQSYTGTTSFVVGSSLGNTAAGALQLTGSGAIASSAAYVFTGGNLTLTNASTTEGSLDRLNDSAPITSNGGTLNYNNTTSAAIYAETTGTITLASGQFNVALGNSVSGTQTLTLANLLRAATTSGSTATITFSAATTGPIATGTGNRIVVTGASPTTGGSIVGPWATIGTTAGTPTDYAIYTTSGTVVPANIAATAESAWTTSGTNVTTSGNFALSANRTLSTLRNSGAAAVTGTLTGFRLETYGVLNGGGGGLTLTGGTLTTPSGGGQLFLTNNAQAITISSTIADNGGGVTLVKSGPGQLTLSGTSSYSGGTFINGGTLNTTADANLGSGGGVTFTGSATWNMGAAVTVVYNRPVTINDGATFTMTSGNSGKTITGKVSGAGNIINASNTGLLLSNTANDFTGTLNSGYETQVANIGDSTSPINIIGANSNFVWIGSTGPKTLSLRPFTLNGAGTGNISASGSTSNDALKIEQDLAFSGAAGGRGLTLTGGNTGTNVFAGRIADGPGSTVSLTKSGGGTWALSGSNTYSGDTNLSAAGGSTLIFQGSQSLSPSTRLIFAQASSAVASVRLLDDATGTINFRRPIEFGGSNTTQGLSIFVGNNSTANGGSSSGSTTGSAIEVGSITFTSVANDTNTTSINVTGSNGYALQTGTITLNNLASRSAGQTTVTALNPTTANMTVAAITMATGNLGAASSGVPVVRLTGTTTNNYVTGPISNAPDFLTGQPLSLEKASTSTWFLTGANTYAGTTTVSAGTLQIGNSGTTGSLSASSPITGSAGATLAFNRTDNYGGAFANNIAGALNISQRGSGTLRFTGTNTYTGTTTVSAGMLQFATPASLYNSNTSNWVQQRINVKSGATLSLNVGGFGEFSDSSVRDLLTNLVSSTTAAMGMNAGSSYGFDTTNATSGLFALSGTVANSTGTSGGARGLVKLGSGTLALTADNTYTGTTAVTAGVLQIGNGGAGGAIANASPVSVGSGAGLAFNRSDALTYGGTVSGLGGLTKLGNGTLTLNAPNTYTGATTIASGTLATGIANAISGSSAITIGSASSRGVLKIDHDLSISSLTFTGSGGDISSLSTGSATFFSTTGTATITVLGGSNSFHANATLSSPTLVDVVDGADFYFHNNLSGGSSLTKSGSGTMWLVGDNDTLSGNLFVTGGRVNIGQGMNQIGTGTTTLSNGSIIDLGGQLFSDRIVVLDGTILNAGGTATTTTIAGIGTVSGSTAGTYNILSTGSALFNAAVGDGASIVSVNVNSGAGGGGQATFDGAIGAQGNVVVLAGGTAAFNGTVAGLVISHGASTFAGSLGSGALVNVENGGSTAFSGALGAGSMVDVYGGGAATISGTVAGQVDVDGTATFTSTSGLSGALNTSGGGVSTLDNVAAAITGDLHTDGSLTINRATGSQTISGLLTGTGSIVKQGSGLLVLSGSNTFSGGFTVAGGTVQAGSASALGAAAFSLNAGGLDLAGNTVSIGSLSGSAASSVFTSGTTAARLVSTATGDSTFAGVISNGAGTVGFEKAGVGALTFTDIQLYTGNTIISGGTLALGSGASIAQSAYIQAGTAASPGGVLDVSALAGGLPVAAGQKLGGYGTVLGDVLIAGGAIIAPGGSIGSLTNTGTQTWGGGGEYEFEITNAKGTTPGTDWDLLTVDWLNITATEGDRFVLDLQTLATGTSTTASPMDAANWDPAGTYQWKFLVATNTSFGPGNFNLNWFNIQTGSFLNDTTGSQFTVAYGGSGGLGGSTQSNELYIVYAAIPEPGTLVLAGIGLAGLALRLRRRR